MLRRENHQRKDSTMTNAASKLTTSIKKQPAYFRREGVSLGYARGQSMARDLLVCSPEDQADENKNVSLRDVLPGLINNLIHAAQGSAKHNEGQAALEGFLDVLEAVLVGLKQSGASIKSLSISISSAAEWDAYAYAEKATEQIIERDSNGEIARVITREISN
jgi:hypothetical protein